jgi:hypothetical protein
MADVERITPPVPALPPPVGRSVGSRQRRTPQREPDRSSDRRREGPATGPKPDTEHIDEYV